MAKPGNEEPAGRAAAAATEGAGGTGGAGTPAAAAKSGGAATSAGDDLRERVARYLRDHHTMTIATAGPLLPAGPVAAGRAAQDTAAPPAGGVAPADAPAQTPVPHAASVFYAADEQLRLVFLSKSTSTHGLHIGAAGPVAVTVTEQYGDWEEIQGVQLWGVAKRLTGPARLAAMGVYLRRFPFARDVMEQPRLAAAMRKVAVYRVHPERVAFTDNTTGVFGREVLDLGG